MSFSATVDRARLLEACKAVMGVVETRSTIPILATVRISVDSNDATVKVEATNMEQHIETTIGSGIVVGARPAADCGHGVINVPAKEFAATLDRMTGETVKLSQDPIIEHESTRKDGSPIRDVPNLRMVADNGAAASFMASDPEDWPTNMLGAVNPAIAFDIPSEKLSDILKRCSVAISTEETRYYLNGINFHFRDDGMTFVSTDGHKLAKVRPEHGLDYRFRPVDGSAAPANSDGVIVPRGAIKPLIRLLPVKKGTTLECSVEIASNRVRVTIGRTILTTKIIDGTFPSYDRVIPLDNPVGVGIDRRTMLDALAMCKGISKNAGQGVKLSKGRDDTLLLRATDGDGGSASTAIVAAFLGEPMEDVGFNIGYLKTAISDFYGAYDELVMRMSDSSGPMTMHTPSRPDDVFVVMPVRI